MQGLYAACCRYLLGETLSEADVRLFPTIFRFDHVYYLRFLLEKAMVVESYPNLQVCHGAQHILKDLCAVCMFVFTSAGSSGIRSTVAGCLTTLTLLLLSGHCIYYAVRAR